MSLDALRKLRDDFTYYAPRCLSIKDKSGKIIPFVFNQAQEYTHQMLQEQLYRTGKIRALILKGRQQGISTYIEGRNFHKTSLNKGLSAYILTHLDSSTNSIFEMVKTYYEHLPAAMKPSTGLANAKELSFDRLGSKYTIGTAGSKAIGRGLTAQLFHGSEVAFWENADAHLAGIGQAIGDIDGTEIVFESTANGINKFYHMVQNAIRGIGDYILIFIPWFWETGYRRTPPSDFVMDAEEAEYAERYNLDIEQMYWRKNKAVTDFNGDYAWFDQEYPATPALAFRASSANSYITLESVEDAMAEKEISDQGTSPKIMGVDPAEYGDDATAIAKRQGRIVDPVKRYYKKGTMEVVGLVAIEADKYHPDAINVDCTGIGSGVADRLLELGYPVNRVHFGEKAIQDDIYLRRKDEMYGDMKLWVLDKPNQLPNDEVLKSDMVASSYTYDSSRRLVIESKEKIKKRGLPSPDSSDAVALTFAVKIYPKPNKPKETRVYNWKAGA
jgi:hypothetical protein